MKIQCNVCEAAEAKVLCCADEAALCTECDQKVHAANKLASKHQRVPLSTCSSQKPKCDICQETVGYFFCLEDRALLCRRCDVSVHTANRLVAAHQRFLLTGVKVGLEATKLDPAPPPSTTDLPAQAQGDISSSKTGGSMSQWPLDEFLELGDYTHKYDFMDPTGSSKSEANCGKFGDADWSPVVQVADMELEGDEQNTCFWRVPEIPSPPTASGLYSWSHSAAFVHHRPHGDGPVSDRLVPEL
ncbi:B-box zinc finger protein 22-like [Salvia miltiorrhiza]|uniref:B-box zinc finger protein 22-like n=1 Tax=Salvia miltiorrhiza TaxID=226208 RepID=UPI0025AB65BB|nr:B-box zinc finger protein 22-like [Salvia miltiorrhiza]